MHHLRFFRVPAPAFFLFLAPLVLFLTPQPSRAMSFPPPFEGIRLDGHLTSTCVPHNGGTVDLQIELTTGPDDRPSRIRRQMNLAVVLDRSGSMADDRKLEYAKRAICSLLDRLSGEDFLSIIIYDDRIETLLPMQAVRNRDRIKAMVE